MIQRQVKLHLLSFTPTQLSKENFIRKISNFETFPLFLMRITYLSQEIKCTSPHISGLTKNMILTWKMPSLSILRPVRIEVRKGKWSDSFSMYAFVCSVFKKKKSEKHFERLASPKCGPLNGEACILLYFYNTLLFNVCVRLWWNALFQDHSIVTWWRVPKIEYHFISKK